MIVLYCLYLKMFLKAIRYSIGGINKDIILFETILLDFKNSIKWDRYSIDCARCYNLILSALCIILICCNIKNVSITKTIGDESITDGLIVQGPSTKKNEKVSFDTSDFSDEKYDKVLKTLNITGYDKSKIKSLIRVGEELNSGKNLNHRDIIVNNRDVFKGLCCLDSNNYSTKINDSGSKFFKKKESKTNKKYNEKVKKFFKKFIKKNKGWMVVVIALALGIILSLAILHIFTGGVFLILIGLMSGMASFRLFRKLKEEMPVKKQKKAIKNKGGKGQTHKNWMFRKEAKIGQKTKYNKMSKETHFNSKKNSNKGVFKTCTLGDGNSSNFDKKMVHNKRRGNSSNKENKKPKKTKKQKLELGFFITVSLLIALILCISLLGIVSVFIATVMIAVLAGMAAFRRVKLLFEGRL